MGAESRGGRAADATATGDVDPFSVRVEGLPRIATEQSVRKHFEEFGAVVKVALELAAGGKSQSAIVTFEDDYSAQIVLENAEFNEFRGRSIDVSPAPRVAQRPQGGDAAPAESRKEDEVADFDEDAPTRPTLSDEFAGATIAKPPSAAERHAGRFMRQYRVLTGQDPRLLDAEKQKRRLAQKYLSQLSTAVDNGNCDEAVEACEELVGLGEEISNTLLRNVLEAAADVPGVERFARAVNACAKAGISFDEHGYASIVGRLLAREAPHAQVRCALNFGIRSDADHLPLVPVECDRESDLRDNFRGAEHDDTGELSDEEIAKSAKVIAFEGCKLAPIINGIYRRRKPCPEISGNKLPVYENQDRLFAYYYEAAKGAEPDPKFPTGWYIGTEVGGGGTTYAHCPGAAAKNQRAPPMPGEWLLSVDGEWKPTPGNFANATQQNAAVILESEDTQKILEMVDLSSLKGRVHGRDPETSRYFAHFFMLLTLEHLAEVRGFRGRWGFRTVNELVNFGLCFQNTPVDHMQRPKAESRRMPLPGWPTVGSQKVCFRLPRGLNEDRCRFKRAESVIISHGNPLRSRVCEGSVTDIDYVERTLYVNINGTMPQEDVTYRLDLYANRTSYERQVTALMQFVTMQRTKICDMLVAAGVGQVDLAVLGGDGFAADKDQLAADIANRGQDKKDDKDELENKEEEVDEGKAWDDDAGEEGQNCKKEEEEMVDGWMDGIEDMDGIDGEKKADDAQPKAATGDDPDAPAALTDGSKEQEVVPDTALDLRPKAEEETKEAKEAREKEERKQKTLALADQDVPGVNTEFLGEAKAEASQMPNTSDAQKEAIANAMAKRLTIVQGPPGTGKTHTSVRIMTMWVKTMGYKPLLCTSECNIAVDNIAEGLVRNGVNVVRVGRPEKVREDLEKAVLDNMVKIERERLKTQSKEEDEEEEDQGDQANLKFEEPADKDTEEWRSWRMRMDERRRKMAWQRKEDMRMKARFLEEADVIAATTVTSGSQALQGFKFHAILIDEVAQATEASTIVPIVCRGASQLVLCGDHCQLPPSVVSREAELRGFSLSLYSRLVEAGVPFRFLDTQYRAHPMLMEFSAACIYQGKLKNGIDGSKRPQPNGIPWPDPTCPAAFFPCDVEEHLDGESKANEAEARVVLDLVLGCLEEGELTLQDIGVVTPYKGQVRTLRRIILPKIGGDEYSKDLEVASVDNFQGREKELIIFSAVRCNDMGGVGFLADWRRLNVMITRARRGLVVVGNAATLCKDPHWKLWLQFTEQQGGATPGTLKQALKDGKTKGSGKGRKKGSALTWNKVKAERAQRRVMNERQEIMDEQGGEVEAIEEEPAPEPKAKKAKKARALADACELEEPGAKPSKKPSKENLAPPKQNEKGTKKSVKAGVEEAAKPAPTKRKAKQAEEWADDEWVDEGVPSAGPTTKDPKAAKKAAKEPDDWASEDWEEEAPKPPAKKAKAKPKAKA